VTLPGYWIGRYPVTVAQFRALAWASVIWLASLEGLTGPGNHPVVNVTLDNALGFCHWLSEKTGLEVMLPSEAEWEKAARGMDGRIYPWGDEPPDETRCNFGDPGRRTTLVGQYSPQGDSPFGCADMAGNVWEWTRSLYREYPYDPGDGREDLEAGREVRWVLRGGAFNEYNERYVRCAYRHRYNPNTRSGHLGFRPCVVSQQD
jgi:formylglycine-generating enzyme required for sulfatase activity